MEKVWFKLLQTDYSPPTVESMGTDKGTEEEKGAIRLGHFISDLKHIDFPINQNEVENFPANMPVFATTALEFKWDSSENTERGGNLGVGAPIAVAAGITVKGNLKLTFKREFTNHEQYDRLDKYIVQMNKSYIQDCLDSIGSLEKYTNKRIWTIFVVTGLMVARGATKRAATESKGMELEVGPEVDVPGIVTATATTNITRKTTQNQGSSGASDFVFAVRLAKINKGLLQTDWSIDTYTKKAVFDDGAAEVDVAEVVKKEGVDLLQVVEDEDLDYALVIREQNDTQKNDVQSE